jgi:hypothetical protein
MSKNWFLLVLGVLLTSSHGRSQSTAAAALTFIPGSSVKVEQLIADCDWQAKARDGSCLRTASQTISRYNIMGTDLGSPFESNGKLIIPFGDTISSDPNTVNYGAGDSIASSTSTDPEAAMLLNFYTNANGSPLFVRMPGINMGGNNVPNAGIALPDGIYLVCNVGADSAAGKPSDHSIIVRFDENAKTFTAGRTLSTLPGHFVITSLHTFGSDVVIFGTGNYRASDVYPSKVPASSFASGAGTQYFAGMVDGQPTWNSTESAAVPVVQDNPLGGPAWPNDSPTVGNMSVVYSNDLKLWLMTYDGGRQSSSTKGVYFTYAQQPWGPWAKPQLIFDPIRDNALGAFIHNPSILPNPPGDGLNGPTIGPNDIYTTAGGAYAPSMIERFTKVSGDTLKIYYMLSTWNPYTIVRMRSEFKITQDKSFSVINRGGSSFTSTGASNTIGVGYGRIQPDSGASTPSGIAIFDYRKDGVLVSEVGVPATAAITAGRMYAEIAPSVNTGLAIANPNSSAVTLTFIFYDAAGNGVGSGSTTILANQQIAQFLDQPPFKVYTTPTFQGTFRFTSTAPIAVIALRGFTNEVGNFLMSTLPVVDTSIPASSGTVVVPHFADGGGWATQILLVNPADDPLSGTMQFQNPSGSPINITIGGQTSSSFNYSVPRRTSQKFSTSGAPSTTASGSIRINPSAGGPSPTPLIVFSYKPAGVTITEAGVPVTTSTTFRVYVESAGTRGPAGSIDSGIAVANASSSPATVTFDITDLAGAPITAIPPVTRSLAASGQTAAFLSELFASLPKPFKGVLRVTGSATLSVVGLRSRINERGEALYTTTPPANEAAAATLSELFFPQVADGGGYSTQFILFSGTAGQSTSGVLKLLKQDGTSFGLTLN